MACTQTNLPVVDTPEFINSSGMGAILPLENVSLGGPSLMVSDNPETVTLAAEGALWWQALPSGDGGGIPGEHTSRVFFWHVNETGANRNLCLTLENRGAAPLQVLRLRGQVASVTNYLKHGRCVAAALVAGTLDTFTPLETITQPGGVSLLTREPWNKNRLMGGEYEITVADPAPDYVLRVVQCKTATNPRSFHGTSGVPLPANSLHPRGSWSGSQLELEARYEIPTTGAPPKACVRLADRGMSLDSLFLKSTCEPQPGDPQEQFDNRANFGVLYTAIRLRIDNRSQTPHSLDLLVVPRGGEFAGAIRSSTLCPVTRGIIGLELVPFNNQHGQPNSNPQCRSAWLGTLVAPPGQVITEVVSLAVGGAANTPLAIAIRPIPPQQ